MINVLLVDDHTIVRKGIRQILEETDDIAVKGEAKNAEEMFQKLQQEEYDMVVLDISLPGRSGVDALKQIKQTHPQLPVLILSMYPENQYALRVMKSGASGYLTKESAPEEMINAIRIINRGKRYINANLAEELANFLNGGSRSQTHQNLTDREYEVLIKIAQGKSLTEIGKQLSLSVKTISTYRSRILKKMNMKTNSDLIKYVMEKDLL